MLEAIKREDKIKTMNASMTKVFCATNTDINASFLVLKSST